jgi:hypothetical protein
MRFDQDNTLSDRPVVELVASLDHMLQAAAARAASAALPAALRQLVLIVADGRFHEKESLRRVVRAAADRPGVLYAFIVLDSPPGSAAGGAAQGGGAAQAAAAGGSILDMQVCCWQRAWFLARLGGERCAGNALPCTLHAARLPLPAPSALTLARFVHADCELCGRQARLLPLHGLLPLPLLHRAARHRCAAAHAGRPDAPVV